MERNRLIFVGSAYSLRLLLLLLPVLGPPRWACWSSRAGGLAARQARGLELVRP